MGNIFGRLFAGVLAAFILSSASAETRTVLTHDTSCDPRKWVHSGDNAKHKCDPVIASCSRGYSGDFSYIDVQSEGSTYRIRCNSGTGSESFLRYGTVHRNSYCPDASWTLTGLTCSRPDCTADQERINGVCVPKCPPGQPRKPDGTCEVPCQVGWEKDAQGVCRKDCTGKIGQSLANEHYYAINNTANYNDCQIKCRTEVDLTGASGVDGSDALRISDGYKIMTDCGYTGRPADDVSPGTMPELAEAEGVKLSPKKPTRPLDCLGSGQGYVQSSSGAVTCVPDSQAPPGQKPAQTKTTSESKTETKEGSGNVTGTAEKTTQTTKNADGTRSTTTIETTSNGDGPNTVTETTETVAPNGEVTKTVTKKTVAADGTETKTGEQTEKAPQDDFCQKNPTSLICKEAEKSVFGGSCEIGFECEGDAATCAIAKASHELKCQGETRGELNDLGDTVISGTDGKVVETIPNELTDLSTAINTGSGGAASCPPLPQIMGKTIEIDSACSILQGLGNAGVALSLLMAGFIVVGGIRGL